jgi:hypothetical protein
VDLNMETILQGLLDMAGVNAAVLFDGAGRLLAHCGRSVYDRALCEQVGGPLARAIDSLQLQHEDWESATAQFSDGTLLLRRLDTTSAGPCVLALVADSTLNPAFATVAIRVSSNKLKRALDGGASSSAVGAPGQASALGSLPSYPPAGPGGSQVGHASGGSRPVLASSGLSWSRTAGGGVLAADQPSSSFLTACSRELARHVGPMSKIFVEEAVRKVCLDHPFSLAAGRALADELASKIEDEGDRQAFLLALKKSGGT